MDECRGSNTEWSSRMLVLSRHKDEWIDIAGGTAAGGLSIVITEIRGDKVRIGFEGPRDITIHRREVQQAIDLQEKEEAN
jgi:carbon storage regulator CsrA